MKKLILASASPRRKELLDQVGAEFTIIPAMGEEIISKNEPHEVVMELAAQKAMEVAGGLADIKAAEECLVLGADTVVALDGKILGKPKDEAEAVKMLSMLCGRSHFVYTGVAIALIRNGEQKLFNFYEKTQVDMYPMTKQEILSYVDTGEPMDKAGAYGIQGKCAIFIERITGDYNNVVGLPVARIYQEMAKLGIEIYSNS